MKRFKKGDVVTGRIYPGGRIYEGYIARRLWRWFNGFDYEVFFYGMSDGVVGDGLEKMGLKRTSLQLDENLNPYTPPNK